MLAPQQKMTPSTKQLVEIARRKVEDMLGKKVSAITCVSPSSDGWDVEVEVVEEPHLISTSDVLATYDTHFDSEGNLQSWNRRRLRLRG